MFKGNEEQWWFWHVQTGSKLCASEQSEDDDGKELILLGSVDRERECVRRLFQK